MSHPRGIPCRGANRKRQDPQRLDGEQWERRGRGEAEENRASLEIRLVTLRTEMSEHKYDQILT